MAKKRSTGIESGLSGISAARHTRRKTAAAPAVILDVPESPASQAGTAVARAVPTDEEIARLAYSYWEARGCQGGSPEEDWHRAERELLDRA